MDGREAMNAALGVLEELRLRAREDEEFSRRIRSKIFTALDWINGTAPRVISLDQLEAMDDEPAWLETEGRCSCLIVRSGGRLCAPENDTIPEELLESQYNVTWRLWSAKPDAELRLKTEWGVAEE